MESIRSLSVDSLTSFLDLFRFALVSTLQLIASILLLYPINVLLLTSLLLALFYKLVKKMMPKSTFSATYAPLVHHENSSEEIKVLKKQIREVQSQLIDLLKKARGVNQNEKREQNVEQKPLERQEEKDSQVEMFLSQSAEKSMILEEVEEELKQTVVAAYQQVVKLRST